MTAIIYVRYSPRPKKLIGGNPVVCESCETQIDLCSKYAAAYQYEILPDGVYRDDNMSGARSDNRPGWQAAMERAKAEKCAIIVYALSRAWRNTEEAIAEERDLRKGRVALISMCERVDTTTALGRWMFTIQVATDVYERERTGERTSDASRRYQAEGRSMSSRAPFGFRYTAESVARWEALSEEEKKHHKRNFQLEENPEEQIVLARMVELHEAGQSARAICRAMVAEGREYRGGGDWHPGTVGRILQRHDEAKSKTPRQAVA
jgi:DNA invertase Pin-like site-specific DNA recombinase